jgi:hypothetical protein
MTCALIGWLTIATGFRDPQDGVAYPRQDVSLFYCSPCGRYAPVNTREEGS